MRVSNCFASLGWIVKPSGTVVSAAKIAVERRAVDAGRRRGAARRSAAGGLAAFTAGGARLAGLVERDLQAALEVVERLLGLVERDVAPLHERLGVELAHRTPLVDALVHQRLRVARIVALVVTVAPVADHVDHDVLVERLPERVGQPRHAHARLGIVAVHVEDRRLDHLRDVGRVLRADGRDSGAVVNPSWLLMTRWIVPPTR